MPRRPGSVGVLSVSLVLCVAACGGGGSTAAGGGHGGAGAAGAGGSAGAAGTGGSAGAAGTGGSAGAAGTGGSAGGTGGATGGATGGSGGGAGGSGGGAGGSAGGGLADGGAACDGLPACVANVVALVNDCAPSGTCTQDDSTTTDGGPGRTLCYANGVKEVETGSGASRTTRRLKNGSLCFSTRAVPATDGGTSSIAVEDAAGHTVGTTVYSTTSGHLLLACDGPYYDIDACITKAVVSCPVGTCR